MARKIKPRTRGELFIERIVWNAAAGAALAVMVLLLLVSLHWLDQIAPRTTIVPGSPVPAFLEEPAPIAAGPPTTLDLSVASSPNG